LYEKQSNLLLQLKKLDYQVLFYTVFIRIPPSRELCFQSALARRQINARWRFLQTANMISAPVPVMIRTTPAIRKKIRLSSGRLFQNEIKATPI